MNNTLTCLTNAETSLSNATSMDDILQIRDKAEAIRVYYKAIGQGLSAQNRAAEVKLQAERRAGQLLAEMDGSGKGGDRKSSNAPLLGLDDLGITKMQSSRWQREATVPDDAFAAHVEKCNEEGVELTQASLLTIARAGHVSHASGENEWYTPPDFIERARRAMGGIDLDPASCKEAQKVVKAKKFYDIADDGLGKKWKGRVWLNPPYSKDACFKFATKLLEHAAAGDVSQACVLVNNATETAWMQPMLRACAAVCFPAGRIRFHDKTGKPANSPLQGQAILYFGANRETFLAEFSDIGPVLFDADGGAAPITSGQLAGMEPDPVGVSEPGAKAAQDFREWLNGVVKRHWDNDNGDLTVQAMSNELYLLSEDVLNWKDPS